MACIVIAGREVSNFLIFDKAHYVYISRKAEIVARLLESHVNDFLTGRANKIMNLKK